MEAPYSREYCLTKVFECAALAEKTAFDESRTKFWALSQQWHAAANKCLSGDLPSPAPDPSGACAAMRAFYAAARLRAARRAIEAVALPRMRRTEPGVSNGRRDRLTCAVDRPIFYVVRFPKS